ncbi:MAG TPA: ATP-binding protein [Candidatus Polarisedimenticolia bacterium]|nr:ATP-binding protein [Candidatus Polarisedimenticolia bacterium]
MARWQKAAVAGVAALSACLAAVAWANAREVAFRRQELQRETRVVARQSATRLQYTLELHLLALTEMAAFFENSEEVTEQEFYGFAATTLKRTPLCLRLPFVDASFHIRWAYPPEANRSLIGFDVRTHPEGYAALLRAMQTKEPVLSPPLRLVGGDPGFILAVPIFRKGRWIGQVVCSFRTSEFFASVVLPEVIERYQEQVLSSGTVMYATDSFDAAGSSGGPVVEHFSLGGSTWEMRVKPREKVVLEQLHSGQAAFWVLGGLLALGVGCLASAGTFWASAITARLRSQGAALHQTREQLDGAMRQLLQAEKLTALGELVAGVAHEINNPLSTIMGWSQLLMAKEIPPEIKRRLETIHSEAERMAKIVSNLLTFARKHPPEKRYLGLNGIIEKTLEVKAYHFRVSQITVEKDLDPDLPKTMLDFHQIEQVLLNLFNNAEQAMLEAGRGGTLRLTTRRTGDRIEARVSDDGPGVPQAIQNRIFEPFFTTKKEGKGTGLGLSLCYGIIQEHGGTIRVESRLGEGATFSIELPIIQDSAAASEEASPRPSSSAPSLRILVIDDEPALQAFLVSLLRSRGHSVDTAADVPEGIRKIAANGHDLIISDMRMPHGSGKDIYKAVMEKNPRLARRIIFTTGDGASAETKRFLKEAGNEIVLKPFKIEQIDGAIAHTMKN